MSRRGLCYISAEAPRFLANPLGRPRWGPEKSPAEAPTGGIGECGPPRLAAQKFVAKTDPVPSHRRPHVFSQAALPTGNGRLRLERREGFHGPLRGTITPSGAQPAVSTGSGWTGGRQVEAGVSEEALILPVLTPKWA